MADFELKHRKHPAYYSCVATGMAVAGPSPDGFMHLTFYRDCIDVVAELFEMPEGVQPDPGQPVTLKKKDPPTKSENGREDVVTVLVPVKFFPGFSNAFAQIAASLKAQEAATPEDE